MKYNNMIKGIAVCSMGVLLLGTSCTDLDEELYGQLSPDTYYQNESEALSSVAGVYHYTSYMVRAGGDGWRVGEYSTDELFCPGRGGGWWDDNQDEMALHACKPTNERLKGCWGTYLFPGIGCANAVIASLEASPKAAEFAGLIAECRALRAIEYFWAMEYWGNIPVFTGPKVDANNLPVTSPVADVYAFIETELKEAAAALPSVTTVGASYYPRLTKEAALCRLAQLYIMGEFYTGTPRWADCENVCNQIINTGAYKLEEHVGYCFREDYEGKSTEVISGFAVDANQNVGGNEFWLYSNGEWDMAKYGCTAYGARGYSFSDEALNRYEAGDERLELLEYGPQFDLNGNMIDAAGNVVTNPADQLVLKPMTNKRDSKTDEGYIVLKYTPVGGTTKGNSLNNDYVLDRYSNVLLLKCEALVRQNKDLNTALSLINQVRNRSELRDLTAAELTLDNIERERANEFIWEGQRRRDMQRFGSFFTATNWWKPTPDATRDTQFYPIPAQQIAANPNLKQNPGY